MLKYCEVYTDLNVVSIPTVPLELRDGIDKITSDPTIEEGADDGIIFSNFRQGLHLHKWRQYTRSTILLLEEIKILIMLMDKITQFSVQSPKLCPIFDQVGSFFWWLKLIPNRMKGEEMMLNLSLNL